MVNTNDEDGGVILGRGRDDGLLGTALSVSASSLLVAEDTGALGNVVGTDAAPRDLAGVGLLEDVDLLAVHKDATVGLLNRSLELACNKN